MASYKDIPMNSLGRYAEAMASARPEVSNIAPTSTPPIDSAYARYVAAMEQSGAGIPSQAVPVSLPVDTQKAQEQAVTNAALAKFMEVQSRMGTSIGS